MQDKGWISSLHLLRVLLYMSAILFAIDAGRGLNYLLQRRKFRIREQRRAQAPTGLMSARPMRQLPLFAFPRPELTVLLLLVPAIAGAGSGKPMERIKFAD